VYRYTTIVKCQCLRSNNWNLVILWFRFFHFLILKLNQFTFVLRCAISRRLGLSKIPPSCAVDIVKERLAVQRRIDVRRLTEVFNNVLVVVTAAIIWKLESVAFSGATENARLENPAPNRRGGKRRNKLYGQPIGQFEITVSLIL